MKTRAHVFVSGRVQGVFFRSFIRSKANLLHLTGWVRNTPDGRVEAVFEGEKEDVEEAVKFCRQGPPGAFVENVNVKFEPASGKYSGFEIRH